MTPEMCCKIWERQQCGPRIGRSQEVPSRKVWQSKWKRWKINLEHWMTWCPWKRQEKFLISTRKCRWFWSERYSSWISSISDIWNSSRYLHTKMQMKLGLMRSISKKSRKNSWNKPLITAPFRRKYFIQTTPAIPSVFSPCSINASSIPIWANYRKPASWSIKLLKLLRNTMRSIITPPKCLNKKDRNINCSEWGISWPPIRGPLLISWKHSEIFSKLKSQFSNPKIQEDFFKLFIFLLKDPKSVFSLLHSPTLLNLTSENLSLN